MIEAVKKTTATKKTTNEGRGDEEFCALTHEAESLSYYPPVILAAGRINGGMGNFIAAKIVKMLT